MTGQRFGVLDTGFLERLLDDHIAVVSAVAAAVENELALFGVIVFFVQILPVGLPGP